MRAARVLAIIGVAGVMLASCHPLINPADPRSTTYLGVPATPSDPNSPPGGTEPEPVLPDVAKWEIVAYHGPGVALPLEITDDDAFIEPRNPDFVGRPFELRITLSDSFSWDDGRSAVLWVAFATSGGPDVYGFIGVNDVDPSLRRLNIFLPPSAVFPSRTRARFRLVDGNGAIRGERIMGYLVGDVDGDGLVEATDDHGLITALDGFIPTTTNIQAIRADINLSGVVDASGFVDPTPDWSLATPGDDLPAAPPEFWPES